MNTTEVTFTSKAEERQLKNAKTSNVDGRFWLTPLPGKGEETPDIHSKTMGWVESLWNCWRRLRQHDRKCDVIYENRPLRVNGKFHVGVKALEMSGLGASELMVATAIVDTFDARFSKRKTMPMFVVDDAEYSLKMQAQEFRRFLHGKMRELDFEKIDSECVTDMLVRGEGWAYFDEGDKDVFGERVHRSEILIDPYEAKQGEAAIRTMYRFRQVSRDALIARFPEYKAEIMASPEAGHREENYTQDWMASESMVGRRDVVDFVEAWHLPEREGDGPDEDCGGRVTRFLAGKTLCYEEWKAPRFPFARNCFKKPRRGFFCTGLIDALEPAQRQINKMVADIAMNVAVTGKGIWTVPEQFDVPVEKLSGYRPFKMAYKGIKPPEMMHPVPVGAATLDLLRQKIAWAHELVGAAQWSAQGKSPLGAGASGIAIDTMEDLLSDRHSKQEENRGMFRLDAAQCILDAAGRVAARLEDEEYDEDEPENDNEADDYDDADEKKPRGKVKKTRKRAYYATWMDKGRLEKLDWNQVSMTQDKYRLQLEPTSSLPHTRAGKLAAVAELIKTGVVPQSQAMSLYDEPDIAHVNRLELATRKRAEKVMEIVGDPRKPMPMPDEWNDLEMMLTMCKQYYNRAQNEIEDDDAEGQKALTRYREFGDFILEVQAQATKRATEAANANMPAAPPGAMPMPPGPPMTPGAVPIDPMAGAPIDPSMMPPVAA
jgi:hypothetical protein